MKFRVHREKWRTLMKQASPRVGTFKRFILNNRFVLFLLILLLIGLNILVFMQVSFIFTPIEVLIKTILLPIIMAAIVYYLLNPVVDFLNGKAYGEFILFCSCLL